MWSIATKRDTVASRFDQKTASRWQRVLRHWSTPLLFILACVVAFVAVHAGWFCVSGIPTRDILVILGTFELGVYLWMRLYSGLQLWRQIQLLCLFVSLQAAIHLSVRLDGFTGDARPIWTWRWAKTPQERFAERPPPRPPVSAHKTVKLDQTTPWDSPGFRGANRSGTMAAKDLATDWRARARSGRAE